MNKCTLSLAFIALAVASLNAAVYNVVSYGADGTDGLSDNAAFNSAISAAVSTGGTVYIPSGIYTITAKLNNITGTCTIVGDGQNCSIIEITSATDLFEFNVGSAGPVLTINDLTLFSTNANAGTALSVVYPSGSPATTGLRAKRLHIRAGGSGDWNKGIRLVYAKNSIIESSMIASARGNSSGYGVSIEGDSAGTLIESCWLTSWYHAVDIGSYQTSLTMDKVLIVDVFRGVSSPVAGNVGAFVFKNGHIDARGAHADSRCLELYGCSNAVVQNSMLLVASDTAGVPGSVGRYNIVAGGGKITIDGNQLLGSLSAGGLVVYSGSSSVVKDNIFHDIASGVNVPLWVQTSASSTLIEGNSFSCGTASPIFDQGTGTVTQYNKIIP